MCCPRSITSKRKGLSRPSHRPVGTLADTVTRCLMLPRVRHRARSPGNFRRNSVLHVFNHLPASVVGWNWGRSHSRLKRNISWMLPVEHLMRTKWAFALLWHHLKNVFPLLYFALSLPIWFHLDSNLIFVWERTFVWKQPSRKIESNIFSDTEAPSASYTLRQ